MLLLPSITDNQNGYHFRTLCLSNVGESDSIIGALNRWMEFWNSLEKSLAGFQSTQITELIERVEIALLLFIYRRNKVI